MSTVQLQGLLKARDEVIRARKELDRARLHSTTYRGTLYSTDERQSEPAHGTFTYRGLTYTK